MTRRFVVRGTEGTLLEVLALLGEDISAIDEGRVFVGRRRAASRAMALSEGDEVSVAPKRHVPETVELLGRHRGLFAFLKPPGLPTVPDHRGNASLLTVAARELDVKPVELHVVTRLDTNVSGVVLLAQGGDAMRRAASLQATGAIRRRYLGLASNVPSPTEGVWTRPIPHAASARGRASSHASKKPATTKYRVFADTRAGSAAAALLVLEPVTGRTHQIRIHSASAGAALLGDVAYGGPARLVGEGGRIIECARVALHASRLALVSRGERFFAVEAPHPADLVALWTALGGTVGDFDEARASPELYFDERAWKVSPNES